MQWNLAGLPPEQQAGVRIPPGVPPNSLGSNVPSPLISVPKAVSVTNL